LVTPPFHVHYYTKHFVKSYKKFVDYLYKENPTFAELSEERKPLVALMLSALNFYFLLVEKAPRLYEVL